MYAEVMAGDFTKMLARAVTVVERRNTIPILSFIRLSVSKTRVEILGTDLDIWYSDGVDQLADKKACKVGVVAVDAHILLRAVKGFHKDAGLQLESDGMGQFVVRGIAETLLDDSMAATGNETLYRLRTLPADDVPALSEAPADECVFEMVPAQLARAMGTVSYAISSEERRYYLNGIFWHAPDGAGLTLAATDGHRIARARVAAGLPNGADTAGMPDVIMPRKAVKVVLAMLAAVPRGSDALIEVAVHPRRMAFSVNGMSVTTKTIDGAFPDYARVIPTSSTIRLEVNAGVLARGVGRVAEIASEKTRAVKLTGGDVPGQMAASVTSPENGEARETMLVGWEGEALTIGFNARYLCECLSQFGASAVVIGMSDSGMPVTISGADDAVLHVLMPMRV